MKLDATQLSTAEKYRLLSGCITPRPIAFVSSISPDGHVNLAPFSFFNGVSAAPMAVVFSPLTKPDGSEKDTLRNCAPASEGGTGEFVLNLAVEGYAQKMAACAEDLPYGEDEFAFAGLEPAASEVVRPPRVAASPIALECRTLQVVRLAPNVPMSGSLVIGEVVFIHADDAILDDKLHVQQDALHTLGRLGGPLYCRTREQFAMKRGQAALDEAPPAFEAPDRSAS